MNPSETPCRSVLYMPGSNVRALDKARSLDADALILDLEDAVAPDQKIRARALVVQAVRAGGFGHRLRIVRINADDTPWGADDLAAALSARPDAILLPKVERPEHVATVARRLDGTGVRLWAMMETPRAMLNAQAIAVASPALEAFVMGTNDLLKDLRAKPRADRMALMPGLGLCLLAARAAGLICIDGVYNAFRDDEGLRTECAQGRDLGFDGKTLIHPAQLAIANEVFAPTHEDIADAEATVAAFAAAQAAGSGVAVLDGRIVENLHVETARQTLAKAAAIARHS